MDKTIGGWDAEILDLIARHVQAERSLLTEYAEAVETAEEADVRYLMQLILDDEIRHHRVFQEMAHVLEGVRPQQQIEPNLPTQGTEPHSEALLRTTERLLKAEREDRIELNSLRGKLWAVEDATLWVLLVDLMVLDTEKHIKILESITSRRPQRTGSV